MRVRLFLLPYSFLPLCSPPHPLLPCPCSPPHPLPCPLSPLLPSQHMEQYPLSYINRVFGLHRLKVRGRYTHFFVMNNIFNSPLKMTRTYDLKVWSPPLTPSESASIRSCLARYCNLSPCCQAQLALLYEFPLIQQRVLCMG